MVAFVLNQRVSTANDPRVVVDAGMAPGTYRFELVVTDSDGAVSDPTFVQISIVQPIISPPPPPPPPRIPPIRPTGTLPRIVTTPPNIP